VKIPALTAVVLILCLPKSLCAGSDPDGQRLVTNAEQQAEILRDNPNPIRLDVSFVAQQSVPIEGHFTLLWAASDRWWRKITLGEFDEVEIRTGEKLYISRNLPFTPLRVSELISLLQFTQSPDSLTVKKPKQRTENGIDITCLQVKGENGKGKPHDICIDSTSRDILSDDWKGPTDELRREQYGDYLNFGSHRYPRKLELLVNGSKVVTAHVESLSTAAFDDALLTPPDGAIERRQCTDMKHAIPISTPEPLYPKSARQNRLMGDTVVAMTVLMDGSVSNIHLIGKAAQSMDEATLEMLKRWKFKPAMCGSEPVISDIRVVVSFRLD
jgi:TonB family protein